MRELVPTLQTLIGHADRAFAEGRIPSARRQFEDLVQKAQEKRDRGAEVAARAMLARCLLKMQQRDEARHELDLVGRVVDPEQRGPYGRYRAALTRLAVDEGPPDAARRAVLDYLDWADDARSLDSLLDAAALCGVVLAPAERVDVLERAIEQAQRLDPNADIAYPCVAWAAALDSVGRQEAALAAWTQAWRGHRDHGRGRPTVAAGWGAGATACRLEDWPLARAVLEETIALGEQLGDCEDLVALALGDLSLVYEDAGDVVEARRLVIRAQKKGREHYLASVWPERWAALQVQAERLEVE